MTEDLDLATAARELNVGVDYLETLMASGRLRDVGVDSARRIRRDDLMSFKATRDAERREGLRDLTSLTEDFGGYEQERGRRVAEVAEARVRARGTLLVPAAVAAALVELVPFDRAGGETLFNAIGARYQRRSVIITRPESQPIDAAIGGEA